MISSWCLRIQFILVIKNERTRKGIANPRTYKNIYGTAEEGFVPASEKTAPKIGPLHGDQPAANARPIRTETDKSFRSVLKVNAPLFHHEFRLKHSGSNQPEKDQHNSAELADRFMIMGKKTADKRGSVPQCNKNHGETEQKTKCMHESPLLQHHLFCFNLIHADTSYVRQKSGVQRQTAWRNERQKPGPECQKVIKTHDDTLLSSYDKIISFF